VETYTPPRERSRDASQTAPIEMMHASKAFAQVRMRVAGNWAVADLPASI
jgi:hypothetical protein